MCMFVPRVRPLPAPWRVARARYSQGGEEIEFDYTELLLEGDGVHGGTPGTNAASVAPAPLAHAPPQQQTHISEADLLAAIMENENGVLSATTHAPQHVQHVQHAAVPVVSTCSAMPTAHAFPLHHQVLYSAAPLQHQHGYVHFTQPMLSSANYASAFMPMLDIPGHNALPPASVPPPQSTMQPISQATPPQAAEQRPAPRARRGETSGAAASSGSKRSSGGSVRRQPAPAPRVGVRSTSKFRGVTHHCRTGRWEAHICACPTRACPRSPRAPARSSGCTELSGLRARMRHRRGGRQAGVSCVPSRRFAVGGVRLD